MRKGPGAVGEAPKTAAIRIPPPERGPSPAADRPGTGDDRNPRPGGVPRASVEPGRGPERRADVARLPQPSPTDLAGELNAEPDVLLDVPNLKVEQISLEVADLRARVSLNAEVLDLLRLHVGADVGLGRVSLDIKGVEAQALLKVRLANVAAIIRDVLRTIDNNPQLLENITSSVARAVDDVGSAAGRAVGDIGAGTGQAVQSLGPGLGALARDAGRAVGDIGAGTGQAVQGLAPGLGALAGDAGSAVRKVGGAAEGLAPGLAEDAGSTVRQVGGATENLADTSSAITRSAAGKVTADPASPRPDQPSSPPPPQPESRTPVDQGRTTPTPSAGRDHPAPSPGRTTEPPRSPTDRPTGQAPEPPPAAEARNAVDGGAHEPVPPGAETREADETRGEERPEGVRPGNEARDKTRGEECREAVRPGADGRGADEARGEERHEPGGAGRAKEPESPDNVGGGPKSADPRRPALGVALRDLGRAARRAGLRRLRGPRR